MNKRIIVSVDTKIYKTNSSEGNYAVDCMISFSNNPDDIFPRTYYFFSKAVAKAFVQYCQRQIKGNFLQGEQLKLI